MKLLLHIGTDKTGSTAIQQHLFLNREWLAERGVYLPGEGLGADNGHAALLQAMAPAALERLRRELLAARAARHRLAVLSWEIMGQWDARRIRRLQPCLAGAEPRVLAYLREQADIAQSSYLQRLKGLRHELPVEAFERPSGIAQRRRSWRACKAPMRNYLRLLRRWRRALPGAELSPREFHREALRGGDVVDDFLAQLGLEAGPGFRRLRRAVNPSLDAESAWLICRWLERGVAEEAMHRRIDAALSWIARHGPGRRHFLSARAVAAIRAHYQRSNRLLARDFLAGGGMFRHLEPCCLPCAPRELELAARAREPELLALASEPVHSGPLLGGAALARGASFLEGWHVQESWGRWSRGGASRLRLRLPFQKLLPIYDHLRLFIKGHYYGDNHATSVRINGLDFGEQALGHQHPGLRVALRRLLPHERLEVELRHSRPISPRRREGAADERALAFGLESIGYELR